ncbi:MAG: DUF4097 domain-containing protein [Oscillospiraceae bacterium]|nr:DUF4097 domain-containing protein [Oscillospiraceae bacterium]
MINWILFGGGILLAAAGCRHISEQKESLGDAAYKFTKEQLETVTTLKISGLAAKVNILPGKSDEVLVEASNITVSSFKCAIGESNTLSIAYKPRFLGISLPLFFKNSVIDIYIPKSKSFENCKIDHGVGNLDIEYIKTENLVLDGGVGNVTANANVGGTVKLNGGVGNMDLDFEGCIKKLNIDGGVGNIKIAGALDGSSKINGGVGDIKLYLNGELNKYSTRINGGVGAIKINGNKAINNKNAEAPYRLSIDGGVGSITAEIT